MKNYINILVGIAVCAACIIPAASIEAAQCVFSRTLELNSMGEDVRCLQKYLNEKGFTIAATGVGSPGNETNLFKDKTKEAVKKWQQANGISPATGNFGPLSKEKYNATFTSVPKPTPTPTPTPAPAPQPTESAAQKSAKQNIISGIDLINDFEDYIDEAEDDGENVIDEEKALRKAQDYVFEAMTDFMTGDYGTVSGLISKARDALEKYSDDIDDNDTKTEAKEALKEAKDLIDDAEDQIEDSDADRDDIREAENLIDKAKDDYSNAKDKYNDEDYEDVIDDLEDIEDYIEDALNLID